MSEVLEQAEPIVEVSNPFEGWKSEPTPVAADPVIDEKDKHIKEDKPEIIKPDEPQKVPGATPKPIQERPDDVKENVKPAEAAITETIKFANDESEKIFNLLKEGKKDEVYSILSEQRKLSEVEKMTPADVIKLNLQYQNKEYTQDEINDLFNEKYELPEKPIQDMEDDEEFAVKMAKYEKDAQKIQNRITRDAKPATADLLKLQKEIILPDINSGQYSNEQTQEELDAQKKNNELFLQAATQSVNSFNGYNTTFKDEEVEIPVAYKLTKEEKDRIQPLIALSGTDAGEFLHKIGWLDENGFINTTKLAEDLPLILDKAKVFQKIASETGNKRHEASIKSIKNIDYSGRKSNGELGQSGQEKEMEMVNHFFSQ